jgi:hypothetical protein
MPEEDMPASRGTDPSTTAAAGTGEIQGPASTDRHSRQHTPVSIEVRGHADALTGPVAKAPRWTRPRDGDREADQASAGEQSSNAPRDKSSAEEAISLDERRSEQQLTQEQATFDQTQFQDKCIFVLRMIMGVLAILAIPVMIYICYKIIFDSHQDIVVKRLAAGALFVSIAGLVAYVWRVFLSPASVSRLRPVTTASEAPSATVDQQRTDQAVDREANPRRTGKEPNI